MQMAKKIDGKLLAEQLREEIREEVRQMTEAGNRPG